jgi:hypothetical protein
MSTPKGYSSQEKEDRLSAQFSTVEPIKEHQFGLSVASYSTVQEWATGTVAAGSTSSVLVITDCAPLKGDIIYFQGGALTGTEVRVWEVNGTSFQLAETLSVAPSAGDAIQVLRHKSPVVNGSGELIVQLSELAIEAIGAPMADDKVKMAGALDTSGDVRPIQVDTDGQLQIDVLSSALPAGAATSAKQDTGNTSLGTIAGAVSAGKMQVNVVSSALPTGAATSAKQPALGTAGAASADVITVQGIASMTALKVDGSGVTQPVSGTVTANAGTGNFNVIQGTATNLKAQAENYQNGTAVGAANPLQVTLANTGSNSTAVKVDGSAVTQPVSAVSLPLPTGAATETTLSALNTKVPSGLTVTAGELLVQQADATATGNITNTQSVSIALNGCGTVGIQISGTWTGSITSEGSVDGVNYSALPSVAMTSGGVASVWSANNILQMSVAGLANIRMRGTTVTSGTAVISLISNHAVSAVGQVNPTPSGTNIIGGVTQSGTWNLTNISGTISLPTGAATETTLSTLNGKVTACNTGAVTISTALPAGTNTIGKVDVNNLSVIDLLDANILDTSSTNINGSASSPTQVVASTAAATKKMQILDTTGAFIGLYTGAAASEVLQLVIGPGSDQTIEHAIPASTRISLKRLDSTTAISSGIVAINFIG